MNSGVEMAKDGKNFSFQKSSKRSFIFSNPEKEANGITAKLRQLHAQGSSMARLIGRSKKTNSKLIFCGTVVGAMPIGLFELMFDKPSKYVFRIRDNIKQPSKPVDSYFIRRRNFKIIKECYLNFKICDAIEEFKN